MQRAIGSADIVEPDFNPVLSYRIEKRSIGSADILCIFSDKAGQNGSFLWNFSYGRYLINGLKSVATKCIVPTEL
ncbi:hypothetical protein B4N84_11945 [Flavobacterium sp. IR1]|nr:hypothetical protein B4N84_11945 [Flavobacterium sp. IR1]